MTNEYAQFVPIKVKCMQKMTKCQKKFFAYNSAGSSFDSSQFLQAAEIEVISNEDCALYLGDFGRGLKPSMICVFDIAKEQGTCNVWMMRNHEFPFLLISCRHWQYALHFRVILVVHWLVKMNLLVWHHGAFLQLVSARHRTLQCLHESAFTEIGSYLSEPML